MRISWKYKKYENELDLLDVNGAERLNTFQFRKFQPNSWKGINKLSMVDVYNYDSLFLVCKSLSLACSVF